MLESAVSIGVAVLIALLGVPALLMAIAQIHRISSLCKRVDTWAPGHAEPSIAIRAYERVQAGAVANQHFDSAVVADEAVSEVAEHVLYVRWVANAAVYIGLGGALVGLQVAIQRLGQIDQIRTADQVESFFVRSQQMLEGFSGAFWAAIAGVVCTVVLNALLGLHSRALEALYNSLEHIVRVQMFPNIDRPDPLAQQVGALASATYSLQLAIGSADRTFAQMDSRLGGVTDQISQVMEGSTVALETARAEFVAVAELMRSVLQDGALAFAASADTAAGALAGAASDAAQAMSIHLEGAAKGQQEMVSSVADMAASMRAVGVSLDQIEGVLKSADALISHIQDSAKTLNQVAFQTQTFAAGVRDDMAEAMRPTQEHLTTLVRHADEAFKHLSGALEMHREFIVTLAENMSMLPEAVAAGDLVLLGERRVSDVQGTVNKLHMEMKGSAAELLQRVAAIDVQPQVQTSISPEQVTLIGREVGAQVRRALQDVEERKPKNVWQRFLKR